MNEAEKKSTNATEAFTAAQGSAATAKVAYEVSLKNIFEGINDSIALESEIKKVEGRISAFEQAEITVEKGLHDAASALSAARQRRNDALDKDSQHLQKKDSRTIRVTVLHLKKKSSLLRNGVRLRPMMLN